jgi:hypothetical protein
VNAEDLTAAKNIFFTTLFQFMVILSKMKRLKKVSERTTYDDSLNGTMLNFIASQFHSNKCLRNLRHWAPVRSQKGDSISYANYRTLMVVCNFAITIVGMV